MGRASIRFAMSFGVVWGLLNGIVVLVVSLARHTSGDDNDDDNDNGAMDSKAGAGGWNATGQSHTHAAWSMLSMLAKAVASHGATTTTATTSSSNNNNNGGVETLEPMHPFFVRSCSAMALNLFVLLAPRWLVCDARARRSNRGRLSQAEHAAALERQQARWDAAAEASLDSYADEEQEQEEEDSFDDDQDLYDDGTQPRNTYVYLSAANILFHACVLVAYSLDFSHVGRDQSLWEALVMGLLALAFVATTPLLYACLQRDSAHWQSEWRAALRRMKEAAELQELERVQRLSRAVALARSQGRETEAQALEALSVASSAKGPSAYAAFHASKDEAGRFFIDYSALRYGALLGSGGFSSVYAAKLGGRMDVAVKVLHVRDLSKEVVEQFIHEVGIVLQLTHPNIVHFLGVVFSPPDMLLVMEKCRRQSLLQLIKEKKIHFTEFQAVSIGLAIADALRYIHEQDILHRSVFSSFKSDER